MMRPRAALPTGTEMGAPVLRAGTGRIEPVWDSERGAPFMDAARIVVVSETGDESVCEEVPCVSYFRQLAQKGSRIMVEHGLLDQGEGAQFPGTAGKLQIALALARGDLQALRLLPKMFSKRRCLIRRLTSSQLRRLILAHRIPLRTLSHQSTLK